jgi:hypothetical protein
MAAWLSSVTIWDAVDWMCETLGQGWNPRYRGSLVGAAEDSDFATMRQANLVGPCSSTIDSEVGT